MGLVTIIANIGAGLIALGWIGAMFLPAKSDRRSNRCG